MNDDLTTQTSPPPIVLKLKKFDDHHPSIVLPHASNRSSTDSLDDGSILTSPASLRVKLKKSLINGTNDHSDDEHTNSLSSDQPAKRSKKSSSIDNNMSNSDFNNDQTSSQRLNEIKSEQSPLVLKIRRDSATTSLGIEPETNRQLLLKLKKNEHGELITTTDSMSSSSSHFLLTEQQQPSPPTEMTTNNSTAFFSNGHDDTLYRSNNVPITNMLSNFPEQRTNIYPQTTTTTVSHIPMEVTPAPPSPAAVAASSAAETHTKELLDEALDSVKNVLMQTFKKNLETGGDLNALKSTLGSDEVAEVFLAKLRQSLKRDTENEQKLIEDLESRSSSNAMISPVVNVAPSVVSSPSSSPLLPPMSSMISISSKLTPPPSVVVVAPPPSPQPPIATSNKRKSSTPSTNPNRFDGTTEEELTKRLLSDILQPNLDIVFVGINPSLYAVHKGHHYGGPGNHFWKLLHMSGLIPNAFSANDDYRMPQYGIGFTNIVQRPTKAGSDITKDEITAGAELLMQKIKMYRPKIVAFNGRGIYEVYAGNKHFHYGKQPELFPGSDTHVFVMPSSSARCSQLPRAEDKLPFYVGLRKLRDFVNGTLRVLNEIEITFPDIKIKDTDDVLQKTIIRISNKPFSELTPETLKLYGGKVPSGQMISKHIQSNGSQMICSSPSPSSSSSSNLVFNTEALTTQTMSILHNTNNNNNQQQQQNGNLLTYDQQSQRIYIQNNGNYTPQRTPSLLTPTTNGMMNSTKILERTSPQTTNNTNAAVLAALANGGYGSSQQQQQQQQTHFHQPQTIYCGGGQQQSFSYSSNQNSTSGNSRSSPIPFNSPSSSSHSPYIVYHQQQPTTITSQSSNEYSSSTIYSPIIPRQLVVVNSSEPLPSFDTILSSSSTLSRPQPSSSASSISSQSSRDSTSSHQSTQKTTLSINPPSIKQQISLPPPPPPPLPPTTTTVLLSKSSLTNKNSTGNLLETTKRTGSVVNVSSEECFFIRYEREPNSISHDQLRFSYVIDDHSPSLHKRLRYVSINDL